MTDEHSKEPTRRAVVVASGGGYTAGRGMYDETSWIPAHVPIDIILFKSDQVAIWLSRFIATPEHLSFNLDARYAPSAPRRLPESPGDSDADDDLLPAAALETAETAIEDLDGVWSTSPSTQTYYQPADGLRLGMSFGERSAEWRGDGDDCENKGLNLCSGSSGSGGGRHYASLDCSMLPDDDVTFWAEWLRLGVERCEFKVQGQVFKEAGERAKLLWQ